MVDAPEKIWAKTHGASTDVISGKRGLIGGWNEHRRDGQVEYVRADLLAGYGKLDAENALLERQIAELRAENEKLHSHNVAGFDEEQALRKAAEADKARLSEALADVLDRFVAAFPASANYEPIIRARAALSGSGAGGWRLVPVEPTRDHLERLATLWGYTLEETADCYGAFLEALPTAPTGDHHD